MPTLSMLRVSGAGSRSKVTADDPDSGAIEHEINSRREPGTARN